MDKFMIDPKEENRIIYREPVKLPDPSKILAKPIEIPDPVKIEEPAKILKLTNNMNQPFFYGYIFALPILLLIIVIAYFIYLYLYGKKSTYLIEKNESKYEISLDEIKEDMKDYLRNFINKMQEWKDYFAGFYHTLLFKFYVDKDTIKTVRYID